MKPIIVLFFLLLTTFTRAMDNHLPKLLHKQIESGKVLQEMNILVGQYQVTKKAKHLEAITAHLPKILKSIDTQYIVEPFYPLIKSNDQNLKKQIEKYLSPKQAQDFYQRLKMVTKEIENGNG